jgi:hypothetical protein
MSTAKRSPPFRAEHVGSLLRPDELVQKRYAVAAGKASPDELRPIEDSAVAQVVKLQKDCGFHAISSGEYTRYAISCFPLSSSSSSSSICIETPNGGNGNRKKSDIIMLHLDQITYHVSTKEKNIHEF